MVEHVLPTQTVFIVTANKDFLATHVKVKNLVVAVTMLLEKHIVDQYLTMPFNFSALSSNCFPNPCKSDGLCAEVRNKEGYMCICKGGYAGRHCESKLCD